MGCYREVFLTHRNWAVSALSVSKSTKKRRYEWSGSDAPHRRAGARRTWARRRTTRTRRRAEGRKRARPDNEADEAGQVRRNLHNSLEKQGGQASERARPPALKAVSPEEHCQLTAKKKTAKAAASTCQRGCRQVGVPSE